MQHRQIYRLADLKAVGTTPRSNWSSPTLRTLTAAIVALAHTALALLFYRDIAGFSRQQPRGVDLDSPYGAVVQATTEPQDVIWAAPNEPLVYLQADRRPASTYAYYQPWLADSPSIAEALLRDLKTHRPPVIVFISDKHIPWFFSLPEPRDYAAAVYALLQSDYTPPTQPIPCCATSFSVMTWHQRCARACRTERPHAPVHPYGHTPLAAVLAHHPTTHT
ncbi:MAG: hypothetical protein JOZ81_12930 [Chloroflexi bacterium]|nr:hypothetical protein [Chloroflexota bacterium]